MADVTSEQTVRERSVEIFARVPEQQLRRWGWYMRGVLLGLLLLGLAAWWLGPGVVAVVWGVVMLGLLFGGTLRRWLRW